MKKLLAILVIGTATLFFSCTKDLDGTTSVDERVMEALASYDLTLEDFQLPRTNSSGSYLERIPQSLDNPITADKVALGRDIFWDPALNLNTFSDISSQTASCGSCHIKDGRAGVPQGLGEGGLGTGIDGQGRQIDVDFERQVSASMMIPDGQTLIDAQPIRPPTNMHVGYKMNALWNGALGNPDVSMLVNYPEFVENHNNDLDFSSAGFPFNEAQFFRQHGFAGPEVQGLAGLRVHRYKFNEAILDSLGYKDDFENVFANTPETRITAGIFSPDGSVLVDDNGVLSYNDPGRVLLTGSPVNDDTVDDEIVPIQYSKIAAAMALSAYTRSVIANDAPFQDYVHGDPNGMTEQEKRGFAVFLEAQCINCHQGPALTDADFHVMGTRDLLDVNSERFQIVRQPGNPLAGFNDEEVREGRGAVSGASEDAGAFMTQTLYNLSTEDIFFHGGEKFENGLADAVDYMLAAQPLVTDHEQDEMWRAQSISDQDRADLIQFLATGTRDNRFDEKYRPGAVNGPPGVRQNLRSTPYCSPNDDRQSRESESIICN
jgi:cytochrome c peroxidase